jgi:hypothetical protein
VNSYAARGLARSNDNVARKNLSAAIIQQNKVGRSWHFGDEGAGRIFSVIGFLIFWHWPSIGLSAALHGRPQRVHLRVSMRRASLRHMSSARRVLAAPRARRSSLDELRRFPPIGGVLGPKGVNVWLCSGIKKGRYPLLQTRPKS